MTLADLPEEYVVSAWLHELATKVGNRELIGLDIKWKAGTKIIEYQVFETAVPSMPIPTEMPADRSLN
jgi:hypothetical protein